MCLGTPPKKRHAASQPRAHVLHRLREGRPDVHVPARRQRHDQGPEPPRLAVGVGHRPHQPEVDLGFLTGRRIVEPHRRCLLPPAELAAREPTQRRVRDRDTVARQQLVHPNQAQRWLTVEPRLDLRPTTAEREPRLRRCGQRTRLHPSPDGARDLVGHRDRRRHAVCGCLLQVTPDRLAIQARLSRDSPRTLPRLAAAQHLSYVLHRDLPKAHPTSGSPSRGYPRPVSALGPRYPDQPAVSSRAGPMTLAIGWPHDPGDPGSDHPRPWPHDPGENVAPSPWRKRRSLAP